MSASLRRPRDFVARYGGEEFACVFPDSNLEQTINIAEYLRQQVAQLHLPHEASLVGDHLTLSLGASARIPMPEDRAEGLLLLADRNLYRAKAQGRDRVVAEAAPAAQ